MKNRFYIFLFTIFLMGTTFGQVNRSIQPKAGPAPEINIGAPESFTLPNGLNVMVVENHKLPRVTMSLKLDNPPYTEGDKKGVSDLTGDMLGTGTTSMSKEDFNDQIDFYGAYVNMSTNGASASTLSKYFPQILSLLADGFINPKFEQEEFDKAKERLIEGLKSDEKSVSSTAARVRSALAYGKTHPFGEFVTEESINNITLKDIQDFYNQFIKPGDAYLVIVGDVTLDQVKKLVSKNFTSWKSGKVMRPKFATPKNLDKTTINFVNMPNAVQSEITILNLTELKMTDDDYFAAILANQILGGGGEGRLFNNLREAHGWTYGSYSGIGADKEINMFRSTAAVRNEVTDSAVVEIFNELAKIRTEPVSEEELNAAKAKYIGNFIMDAEKPEVIAAQALKKETQGLPDDFYQNYIKRISAVTPEQVLKAANKYFSFDNARILVVGKADEVQKAIENMDYPVAFFDKYANETSGKEETIAVPAGLTPIKVVNNYIKAIGGEDKVKALKSFSMDFKIVGAAPQDLLGQVRMMHPNLSHTIIKMGAMVIEEVKFDGTTQTTSGMQGSKTLTGEETKKFASKKGLIEQAYYTPEMLESVVPVIFQEKDAYKIRVNGRDGDTLEFYDVDTFLLVQEVKTVEGPQGSVPQKFTYSDYEDVDGILFPMKIEQEVGGQAFTMEVTDIKVNEGVTAADFK